MIIKHYFYIILTTAVLTSCGGDLKSKLGLTRSSPDEFSVVSYPPLSIPPVLSKEALKEYSDLKLLELQNESDNTSYKLKNTITDNEQIFRAELGLNSSKKPSGRNADRSYIENAEQDIVDAKENSFLAIFNKKKKGNKEKVIEPVLEKQRINNNLKQNIPINQGSVIDEDKEINY